MTNIEDRLDYEAVRVIALTRWSAFQMRRHVLSAEAFVHTMLATAPNMATRAVEVAGGNLPVATLRCYQLLSNEPCPQNTTSADYLMPRFDASARAMGRSAEDYRQSMRSERIGVIHLLLGALRTRPLLQQALVECGVNVKAFDRTATYIAKKQSKKDRSSTVADEAVPAVTGNPLRDFCINFTEQAALGRLSPVIGRDDEINRIVITLSRATKHNVLILGSPGVGKSALVEKLAQRIVDGNVPRQLLGRQIFGVDMAAIVAGTLYRGQFEEKLKALLNAARENPNSILFFDEAHTLVGAGSASGTLDASNILKPALARGEIWCIAATTDAEYRKYIRKDRALDRRFQCIRVDEPSREETVRMLQGLRSCMEQHHGCLVSNEAIEAVVELSGRHVTGRHFPDKAIDVMDEMCARFGSIQQPLGREHAAQTVAAQIGVPVETVLPTETQRTDLVRAELMRAVVGQDQAVAAVVCAIRRAFSLLRDPRRPLASLVFGGPSSTGKSYVAQIISRSLYPQTPLIRINLAEFSEKHSVSRLFGAPPGYIGYGDGNQLTDPVRRHPNSVIVFDNTDKAHAEVLMALMEMIDTGSVTDAEGEIIDLRSTFIVFTTVAGSLTPVKHMLGFNGANTDASDGSTRDHLVAACRDCFGDEFVNRIDEFVPFMPLGPAELRQIAVHAIAEIADRLQQGGCTIRCDETVVDRLACGAENARIVRARIRSELEPLICESLAKTARTTIRVRVKRDQLVAE